LSLRGCPVCGAMSTSSSPFRYCDPRASCGRTFITAGPTKS